MLCCVYGSAPNQCSPLALCVPFPRTGLGRKTILSGGDVDDKQTQSVRLESYERVRAQAGPVKRTVTNDGNFYAFTVYLL